MQICVSVWRLLVGVAALSIIVTAIEMVLAWNHVRDVYACSDFSQLFPLMVGLTNFLRVLGKFARDFIRGDIRIQWVW